MPNFGSRFGAHIKNLREYKGLSSGEVARDALGDEAKRSRLSDLENGKVKNPQAKTIDALATYFDIQPQTIAELRNPPAPEPEQPALPRELLENIATRFGAENPDAPPETLVAYLKETAREYAELRERLNGLEAMDGRLSNLRAAAQDYIDKGQFDEADEVLADAEEMQQAEHTLKEVAKQANVRLTRAMAALMSGKTDIAANHFETAAGFFAPFDTDAETQLRHAGAAQLYERGLRFGGTALVAAITLYETNLSKFTVDDAPQDWAMTQNNLAIALRNQASRVEGAAATDLLSRAVTAYDAALTVHTVDDAPQQWATTQNNLATALINQASRVEGAAATDLLSRAVTAFDAALTVRTFEDAPQQWAMTQNNLANALANQASRVEGAAATDLLFRAVTAFEAALTVYTVDDAPQDWATTQNNLANVLGDLAMHSDGADVQDLFTRIFQAYEDLLTVRTREHMPQLWAETQLNIGLTWLQVLQKTNNPGVLDNAEKHFTLAGEVFGADSGPYYTKNQAALAAIAKIRAALAGDQS